MARKMTIDGSAQITAREFAAVRQEMVTKDLFKEGTKMILDEIGGLREEVKIWRQETRIEVSELRERVDKLEKRMMRVETMSRR